MDIVRVFIPILISISLIFVDSRFSFLDSTKSYISSMLIPVKSLVSVPNIFFEWVNEQGQEKSILIEQNKQLTAEIVNLKIQLNEVQGLLQENNKINQLINNSLSYESQKNTIARVLEINSSRLKKILNINKGSSDNLSKGRIVYGPDGLVGEISDISQLDAKVRIITDPTQFTPIKNSRNSIRGIARGLALEKNLLEVLYIEKGQDIRVNDVFITSGIGEKYPVGIPVGKVVEVNNLPNEPFQIIRLKPIQNINSLDYILIGGQTNAN